MARKGIAFLLLSLFAISVNALVTTDQKPLTSGWRPFEKGFETRSGEGKGGSLALICQSTDAGAAYGAQNVVSLNQSVATPFAVSAWSRSQDVSGSRDDGYALYLDLTYMDGTHLWGTISPFECGTHDWQEKHVRIAPTKPVKVVSVFLLLRRHTGRAWFSNVTLLDSHGESAFDFQEITAPTVPLGERWFIRDVEANSKILPASQASSLRLRASVSSAGQGSYGLAVTDTKGSDRALTLYYCERFDAVGGKWWSTIRNSTAVGQAECATLTSASSGANGLASLYPFAAVTKGSAGRMLAVSPSLGPRLVRLFYSPGSHLLCAAFDVALVHRNRPHPGEADAAVLSRPVDPAWGLRDAARQYYLAFPEAFRNRNPKQGIWIPFTDPATLPHPEDFGIAVHEGDGSVLSDNKLGILSFRYTEPMTWWMPMDPAVPRTYEAAMGVLGQNLRSLDSKIRRQAEAVLSSGTWGLDGRTNVSFENQPWANGAVWVLNPNPGLADAAAGEVQANIVFDPKEAKLRYFTTRLSGEYLDSLEDHSDVLDYRMESLAASSFVPSFDDSQRPVIPQSYSTYEIAKAMSSQLHAMGKLLMANSTPRRMPCYMPLVDCAGIEVNWMDGGSWSPDSDDVFCYRRTLGYHKPYMLLQNTDFSKFGSHEVEMYFRKCLFYGVFPSFFSADAATHPYWETPALYERDRPLFKKFIPLIKSLAASGWEPVTKARTSDPAVLIERFGDATWTLFNDSSAAKTVSVSFEAVGDKAVDLASRAIHKVSRSGGKSVVTVTLEPGDCRVVRLQDRGRNAG